VSEEPTSTRRLTISSPSTFNQGALKGDDDVTKVEEYKGLFGSLFKRMDQDRDLYLLKPYIFRNVQGQPVKDADNVTLNAPALYADKVQSAMVGANRRIKVIGNIKDSQKSIIQNFCDAVELDIEEKLEKMGEPALYPFIVEQVCLRGREAVRVAMLDVEGKLTLDVMAYDTRYFVNRYTKKGLDWAASFTNRLKADIKDDYGYDAKTENLEVVDFWDMDRNKVWTHDKVFHTADHSLGFTPIALQIVPSGSMLKDSDNLKHRGESLYRNSRALFPELNKTATILQSLNVMQFRPALQRASQAGEMATPVNEYPHGSGKVSNVEITGGIRAMPLADIHSATRLFYSALEAYLQRATLPAIDYGNLSFPLSAVAIKKLTENKNEIFIPRLHSIAKLYVQIMKMSIGMLIKYQGEIELGPEGHKTKFSYKDLEGEYTLEYSFKTVSPEEDIANYAIAEHAMNFLDTKTVLTDILGLEHPEEVMNNRMIDKAALQDPAIGLFRSIHALITQADLDPTKNIEARIAMERLATVIAQRHAPEQPDEATLARENATAQPGSQGQGYLPLFGGGQGGARKSTVEVQD